LPHTQPSKISPKNSILGNSLKIGFKDFEGIRVLGAGSFGKVFLVRRKRDGKVFAMKMLKKRDLIIKKQLRYAVTEANVLKKCRHPFVLTLHHAFQVKLEKYKFETLFY
jgi:serine/threonine protein kinase